MDIIYIHIRDKRFGYMYLKKSSGFHSNDYFYNLRPRFIFLKFDKIQTMKIIQFSNCAIHKNSIVFD